MEFFKVENDSGDEIEIQSPVFGYYGSGAKKMFVLSDHPPDELGMSHVFQTYIANPSEHDWKDDLYLVGMGNFGTRFLCWAQGAEDALEIAAEAALEAGMKGFFTDDEEMKKLYDEAREELGPDADDDEVAQQAEADLTYTESGWITAYEWSLYDVLPGLAFGDGQDLYMAAKFVCEAYTDDSDEVRFELVPNRGRRGAPHYEDYVVVKTHKPDGPLRFHLYAYNATDDAWGPNIGLARGYASEREAFDWAHRHAVQRGIQDAVVARENADKSVTQIGNVGEGHRGGPQYNANAGRTNKRGHQLVPGTWVRVYEDRKASAQERYTAVLDGKDWNATARGRNRIMMGIGESGGSYFTEGQEGRHLGKEVPWDQLPAPVRREIETRGKPEYSSNARGGELDENAARELELYIENEYSLIEAPNSQGKAIEKNLLRKIKQGKFDYEKSIDGWMYLIEDGAKKYSKEFSTGTDWHKMFSPATRRFVAERFAQHFAQEHGVRVA